MGTNFDVRKRKQLIDLTILCTKNNFFERQSIHTRLPMAIYYHMLNRQYDFNVVHHPCQDSNLGPRPRSEPKYDALDRSAMDPIFILMC